jgi:transcriptional regulator with XRE-family HTH domain
MTLIEFAQLLRRHRQQVKVSQLAFSLAAGISQRHLSALEVGRAKPSREMVGRLAEVLGLTLVQSNELLLAAGFAPRYPRRSLDERSLANGARALDLLLRAAQPYPAFVIDADTNIVRANASAGPLVAMARAAGDPPNLLWATLHPQGWRPHIVNLDAIAPCLLRRFQRERVLGSDAVSPLWPRLMTLPTVADWLHAPQAVEADDVMLTIDLRLHGQRVRWFSTVMTLGSPLDVTLQEHRVECFMPADEPSEAAWSMLRSAWAGTAATEELG